MKITIYDPHEKRDKMIERLDEIESEKEKIRNGTIDKKTYFRLMDEEREIRNQLGIEYRE